jgi:hypothetical protein
MGSIFQTLNAAVRAPYSRSGLLDPYQRTRAKKAKKAITEVWEF